MASDESKVHALDGVIEQLVEATNSRDPYAVLPGARDALAILRAAREHFPEPSDAVTCLQDARCFACGVGQVGPCQVCGRAGT